MQDFIEFPKAYTQFKTTGDQKYLNTCKSLIEKYQVYKSSLDLGFENDTSLEPIRENVKIFLQEDQQIPQEALQQLLSSHFITMELEPLSELLRAVVLYTNNIEILCWLYISQVYRRWFHDDEVDLGKSTANNLKKIRNYQSKNKTVDDQGLKKLLRFVDLITYLNMLNEFDIDVLEGTDFKFTIEELNQFNFATEYLIVHMVVLLCSKPFSEIELAEDYLYHLTTVTPDLITLYNNIKVLKLTEICTIKDDLNLISFLYEHNQFLSYFDLIVKFKWFLSFISFTNRIYASQLCDIIATTNPKNDTQSFIFLISLLNLNKYGIGYDYNEAVFYNKDLESSTEDLAYDLQKINHLITSQKHVLDLTNELMSQF